jgi:prepilin-type processing-associated H-X9-DG protein
LVELLVVIAIIGMLVSLLLPAVNAARETGRRAVCLNNMRQVALALVNYDNTRNGLPGISNERISKNDGNAYIRPLLYEIFPQLERNDLFEAYSRENLLDHIPTNNPIPYPPPHLPVMVCPSDPQNVGPVTAFCYNYGYMYDGIQARPRNKANGVFDILDLPRDSSGNIIGTQPINYSTPIAYMNSNDGATNTVMLSENMDAARWTDVGFFTTYPNSGNRFLQAYPVAFVWQDSTDIYNLSINRFKGQSLNQMNDSPSEYRFCRPSSNHPSVVNVAFCDAHARVVHEGIDYVVWAAVMAPKHSQVTVEGGGAPVNLTLLRPYIFDESHIP